MANTNYFSGIVKILETPKEYCINRKRYLTVVRVELPQKRKTTLVTLLIWGMLGREVKKFYTSNDYMLIEGYTSIRYQKIRLSNKTKSKRIFITGLRVYPSLLNSKKSLTKIDKKDIR